MRLIKIIVFFSNILLLFVINIYLWTVSWCWGLGGVIGIVGFFVGYRISGGMTLAPRDYWRDPEYKIFRRKIAYGNTIAGSVAVISSFIIMFMAAAFGLPVK